jgi:ribonuclease E
VYHAIERGDPAIPPPDFVPKALVRVDSIPPEEFEAEIEAQADEMEAQAEAVPTNEAPQIHSERLAGAQESEADGEGEASRRRRRRRRRRGGRNTDRDGGQFVEPNAPQPSDAGLAAVAVIGGDIPGDSLDEVFSDGETDEIEAESFDALSQTESGPDTAEAGEAHRRRRSRRGGRNRHREGRSEALAAPETASTGEWLPELRQQPDSADDAAPKSTVGEALEEAHSDAQAKASPAEPSAAPDPEPVSASAPAAQDAASLPDSSLPPMSTGPKRTGWWQRAKASFGGK